MASIREDIEAQIRAKRDPNGSGSNIKTNSLLQYLVNDEELVAIKAALDVSNDTFTEEFYNIENETYLVWNANEQKFVNKVTGEDYLIEILIDDFESGSFATEGWSVVNGGENDWFVGAAAKESGNFGAYISTDGGTTNTYSSVGGALDVSHIYIDIDLPNATNEMILEFAWRCEAEAGFDYGNVYNADTITTPFPNVEVPAGLLIGQAEYNNQSVFIKEQIQLDIGQAGTTRRFIFSWRNDSSIQNQPPMGIDNVKILYS